MPKSKGPSTLTIELVERETERFANLADRTGTRLGLGYRSSLRSGFVQSLSDARAVTALCFVATTLFYNAILLAADSGVSVSNEQGGCGNSENTAAVRKPIEVKILPTSANLRSRTRARKFYADLELSARLSFKLAICADPTEVIINAARALSRTLITAPGSITERGSDALLSYPKARSIGLAHFQRTRGTAAKGPGLANGGGAVQR